MEWINDLSPSGCAVVLVALVLVAVVAVLLYKTLKSHSLKFKDIELLARDGQKVIYREEGKNILDNQCANAHNLLKKIRVDIIEKGKKEFGIVEAEELFLLEDIARLIECKINYEVKCDLTRNHISEKGDLELTKYAEAKAIGYCRAVQTGLYDFNVQLPRYNLPDLMKYVTQDEYKKLFEEIYFTARKIAL